jgi:hypothetical protein
MQNEEEGDEDEENCPICGEDLWECPGHSDDDEPMPIEIDYKGPGYEVVTQDMLQQQLVKFLQD